MTTAYDLFDHVQQRAATCLSSRTIHSLRDYFFGYIAALDDRALPLASGAPPFTQFTDWLARRYGRSARSLHGKWTRCHMGWWTLLDEACDSEEEAFKRFFQMLDEFRRRQAALIASCERQPEANATTVAGQHADTSVTGFKAVQYSPDTGVYLYTVYTDSSERERGYFGSMVDLVEYVRKRFGPGRECWTPQSCIETGEHRTRGHHD